MCIIKNNKKLLSKKLPYLPTEPIMLFSKLCSFEQSLPRLGFSHNMIKHIGSDDRTEEGERKLNKGKKGKQDLRLFEIAARSIRKWRGRRLS